MVQQWKHSVASWIDTVQSLSWYLISKFGNILRYADVTTTSCWLGWNAVGGMPGCKSVGQGRGLGICLKGIIYLQVSHTALFILISSFLIVDVQLLFCRQTIYPIPCCISLLETGQKVQPETTLLGSLYTSSSRFSIEVGRMGFQYSLWPYLFPHWSGIQYHQSFARDWHTSPSAISICFCLPGCGLWCSWCSRRDMKGWWLFSTSVNRRLSDSLVRKTNSDGSSGWVDLYLAGQWSCSWCIPQLCSTTQMCCHEEGYLLLPVASFSIMYSLGWLECSLGGTTMQRMHTPVQNQAPWQLSTNLEGTPINFWLPGIATAAKGVAVGWVLNIIWLDIPDQLIVFQDYFKAQISHILNCNRLLIHAHLIIFCVPSFSIPTL